MRKTRWTFLTAFFFVLGLFTFLQAEEIYQAAGAGDLAKVQALVEGDPALVKAKDENGRTALHFAARGRHLDLLRYLVDKGCRP